MARPRKPVNEALLRKMVAEGLSLKQIASLLEVHEDTLIRNFGPLVRPLLHESGGRQQTPIDENKVRKLASVGLSAEEIGALLDVSGDTILRRFEEELKIGIQKRNANLKSELYRRALSGKSDVALIFALKGWCGMNDRAAPEDVQPKNWFYETIRLHRELLATQKQNALNAGSAPAPPALSFGGITLEPPETDLDAELDVQSEPIPIAQDQINGQELPVSD